MAKAHTETGGMGWLVFFHSVPTKPVANRMKIWRKLVKAGALPFKGAVYVLPYSDEHLEFLQCLVPEVESMNGEAAFVRAANIGSMTDTELIALFDRHRDEGYRTIKKELDELEQKTGAIKKSSGGVEYLNLSEQLGRLSRSFEEVWKTDFFSSTAGNEIRKRIKTLESDVAGITSAGKNTKEAAVIPRRIEDYTGKVWVTRKKPYIDRMASAWLIRRFVDSAATFRFIDESEAPVPAGGSVYFDMQGSEFTHVGDLCTFEVMLKSFGLKGKGLKAVAEIVHELDVRDDRYRRPESIGVEDILSGIRKTVKDDAEALETGMGVFEMLYSSKS